MTLGNPLAHGAMRLAKDREDFKRRVEEHEPPLCPPELDSNGKFSFEHKGEDGQDRTGRAAESSCAKPGGRVRCRKPDEPLFMKQQKLSLPYLCWGCGASPVGLNRPLPSRMHARLWKYKTSIILILCAEEALVTSGAGDFREI